MGQRERRLVGDGAEQIEVLAGEEGAAALLANVQRPEPQAVEHSGERELVGIQLRPSNDGHFVVAHRIARENLFGRLAGRSKREFNRVAR